MLAVILLLPALSQAVTYWGSTKSKTYHRPACHWINKIKKQYRVSFTDPAEARSAGYHPCETCLPATREPGRTPAP
jgi:methylphosphotriester-DNA--protein-cysteine methyltransferase